MTLRRCLITIAILTINGSDGFSNIGHKFSSKSQSLPLHTLYETSSSQNQEQIGANEEQNNNVPKRKDTCKLLLSGIIGTEPKEAYLSNNHYVINFALAVVGHYDYIHDWEKSKPQETMWINVEVWDAVAKDNIQLFRKGATLNGLGTLIFNKWIDKSSGEERKQFKHRLLKVISKEEMSIFEDTDFDLKATAKTDELDSRPPQESFKVEKPAPITQSSAQPVQQMQPNYNSNSPQKLNQPVQQMRPHVDSETKVERVNAYTSKDSEGARRQVPQPPPPPPPPRRAPAPTRVTYGSYDPDAEE